MNTTTITKKSTKPQIVSGGTYTLEQFSAYCKWSGKSALKKFIMENAKGFYSYQTREMIPHESVLDLCLIVGQDQGIYHYFNTRHMPFNIVIKDFLTVTEHTTDRNIYTIMAMPQRTYYRASFQVVWRYGEEPITITHSYSSNTTLSMRDIANFM